MDQQAGDHAVSPENPARQKAEEEGAPAQGDLPHPGGRPRLPRPQARARVRRMETWAARVVQRHVRGLLGRKRALEELWRQQSVVRSMYALKEMRTRSRRHVRGRALVRAARPADQLALVPQSTRRGARRGSRPTSCATRSASARDAIKQVEDKAREMIVFDGVIAEDFRLAFHVSGPKHPIAALLDNPDRMPTDRGARARARA